MNQNQLIPSCSRNGQINGNGAPLPPHRLNLLPPDDGNDAWHKVERSISYMVEHIDKPLQVATLAAQANVSPSHFFALFKRRTGCPPMDYFTRLRMSHARRILGSTSASVKEVAAALGYDDPFYFSRVFKAVNKVPPSEYRARHNQWKEPVEPATDVNAAQNRMSYSRWDASTGTGTNYPKKVLSSIP